MQLNPYLLFNGNAEEAIEFYRSVLGGKLDVMRFAGTPAAEQCPPGWEQKVLHARLDSPAGILMVSDCTPEQGGAPGTNFSLTVNFDDEAEAERAFNKLASGGTVKMPFESTFWAKKYGAVDDKFGISWMINCAPVPVGTTA